MTGWHGVKDRECGEHDTLGRRAWCSNCSSYCSPATPCLGCEAPGLRRDAETLQEARRLLAEIDGPETGKVTIQPSGPFTHLFDVIKDQ